MAKYQRTSSVVVDATQYNYGMEDGVESFAIFTNEHIGTFYKGEAYPKNCLNPFRFNHHGDPEEFNWGDYLVTYENKSVGWIKKEVFEKEYKQIEN